MKSLTYLLQLVFLCVVTTALAGDVLRYVLAPGSTITPYAEGTPVGPPEPLAGSFEWVQYDCGGAGFLFCFAASYLDFESQSFSITLNTALNDLSSSVFANPTRLTFFGEVVDVDGLEVPTGRLFSQSDGSYSGPPDRPTALYYPNVRLGPIGAGSFVARLELIALMDSDGDGVPDGTDQCPNTPAGAVVNAHGCSIEQLAPCEGPPSGGIWENHERYVVRVTLVAEKFFKAGLITKTQRNNIIKRAAKSDCGKKHHH